MDPGSEKASLEREYLEACRDLPPGVREEILPERLATRGQEDDHDLGLKCP